MLVPWLSSPVYGGGAPKAVVGAAKAVGRAALADLIAVPGVSTQLAQQIYDHFNGPG